MDAWNALKRLDGDSSIEPNRPPTLWLVSVGISNYQHDYQLSTLEWTVNGVHNVANLFKEKWNLNQENLFILTNQGARRRAILDSLEVLTNPIKVGKEDMVIFFFSGHGMMAGNKIGICPWDYATPQHLISDEEIIGILSDKVDPKLLERLNFQRRNISGGLAYITSTRAGSNSYGTGDEGGFFTKYLLEGLEKGLADNDENKIVTIDEIFQYIRLSLSKRTNDAQIAEINEKGYDKNMPVIILSK
ncbi:MAG: caspase family protein [Saprospiraceae bacterium]|nr:caspase family protein [Saprospiraceae bacterium]